MHTKKFHGMELDPSKQTNHVLHEFHTPGRCHRQSSSQWRGKAWDQCQVIRRFRPMIASWRCEEEFEIFQVPKQPDEVYDLTMGPSGVSQGKRSNPW